MLHLTTKRTLAQVGILIAATLFVFWPTFWGGWFFDDEPDILYNTALRSLDGLIAIWRHPAAVYDFYPLKYTVQWVQWHLWQQNALPYHVTNVVLHVTSALLFWRLLTRLKVKHAWLGGLLFAVHPIVVESVAWNAELKNTLSLPPLLLSLTAFVDYVETGSRRRCGAAFVWFVISLLCKASAVPLSAFLLLYVWWRRGEISRRHVLATLPFLAVALVFSAVTIWFQQERGMAGHPLAVAPIDRLALIGSTTTFYLWKCLWPTSLMPIYPHWSIEGAAGVWRAMPALALVGVIVYLWRHRQGRARHALLAIGWFVLFIAPASGVFLISYMRFSWVMDHMAYHAVLGLAGLGAAGVALLEREAATTNAASYRPLVAMLAGGLVFMAHVYAVAFRSDIALWSYATSVNPRAWVAHNNLGIALRKENDTAGELAHFTTAVTLKPDYAEAHGNLGDVLLRQDKPEEALVHFRQAIELDRSLAGAYAGMAKAFRALHQPREAADAYATSVRLRPDDVVVWNEYAQCLAESGRVDEAIAQLRTAVRLNPRFKEGYGNLALLLQQAGRIDEAIEHYEQAIALAPNDPDLHHNLGRAFQIQRRYPNAIRSFQRALELRPAFAVALYDLGISLYLTGQADAARAKFAQARALDPSLPPVNF